MRRGGSRDSGAGTSAQSEASWRSSRRTVYWECTGTLSSAPTAKNVKRRVPCRFRSWTWIGRSSTIRNVSFVWLALMHAQLERSLRSSHRRISYLRWRCGAGGGSRTHFSHPLLDAYYGLLRDVSAARRLSRSAFGGLANPGLVAPGNLDR